MIVWRTAPSEAARWKERTTVAAAMATVAIAGMTGSISRRTPMRFTTRISSQGRRPALTTMVMPAITHKSALPVVIASTAPATARKADWAATA